MPLSLFYCVGCGLCIYRNVILRQFRMDHDLLNGNALEIFPQLRLESLVAKFFLNGNVSGVVRRRKIIFCDFRQIVVRRRKHTDLVADHLAVGVEHNALDAVERFVTGLDLRFVIPKTERCFVRGDDKRLNDFSVRTALIDLGDRRIA